MSADTPRAIRTRKPTGATPFPLILIEGPEKSGKSWAAAEFTGSDRVGTAYWLDISEGAADEYAAVPGASYEVIDHNGTWGDILAQVTAVRDEAGRAAAAGANPVVLVVDSMTAVWEQLKDWISLRARESKAGKKALAADPDAEVKPAMNLWNDAADRHGRLMRILMTFPGIVIVTARGKEVASLDKYGQPTGSKEYKVEGHKNLAFDSSAWVRMSRSEPPIVVGVRSVHSGMRPGVDKPVRVENFTVEWLVFELLKAGSAPRRLTVKPTLGEVGEKIAAASSVEELKDVWSLASDADYLDAGEPPLRSQLMDAAERLKASAVAA